LIELIFLQKGAYLTGGDVKRIFSQLSLHIILPQTG